MFNKLLGQFGSMLGGALGGKIGGALGGGVLSRLGSSIGSRYGAKFGGKLGLNTDRKLFYRKQEFTKLTNLRDSFYFSTTKYGSVIPLVFGKMRVQGNIIWLNNMTQNEENISSSKYFDARQVKAKFTERKFSYNLSFAVAVCQGKISEISRVWNGDELIDLSPYRHRIYCGYEDQMPDPLINDLSGGNAPAFRDLAYVVFEEMPLSDFDDVIPNFSFEVTRRANINEGLVVEDMVKSMIMIPGSGEYVYDTMHIKKTIFAPNGLLLEEESINVHNDKGIADSLYSLNQLQSVCQNVEWVAPVACWFGDSTDAADCIIRPCIEYRDDKVHYNQEWRVGKYDRSNAPEISKSKYNNPNYGGSINDDSIIRYLVELRNRGLKIMFYPMFFLDVHRKPWRGHLTGSPEGVRRFFTRQEGYNQFILHYADLVKNHVDAFVIGSELIGLTKVKDENNKFPAVEGFVNLAAMVKNIVGDKVQVTYAADWSEYHHTEGGWYNLDPLWSSPHIDFIGIDLYFPITDTTTSYISDEEIMKGFNSGEGMEYYVDRETGTKYSLEDKYAWKNIKYWWENQHINPDKQVTEWVPKSKKIWFTEFGFPSIDKAPNQPNVFFDPECLDGGVPRYSNGEVNFSLQRRCISKFIKFWQEEEYIDNMFLWTWDARPYPAWPHMPIWTDNNLWEKGHWVNNKFGAVSIGSIILELSKRSGIDLEDIDISSVDESIEGMIINTHQTCLDAIHMLRMSYFFDITANHSSKIKFIKRAHKDGVLIHQDDLLKVNQDSFITSTDCSSTDILSNLDLHYINNVQDYESYHLHINDELSEGNITEELSIPIALSPAEAEYIGNLIIRNALFESQIVEFILPIEKIDLFPSSYFTIYEDHSTHKYLSAQQILQSINPDFHSLEQSKITSIKGRIVNYKIKGLKIYMEAILDDLEIYKSQFESLMNLGSNFDIQNFYAYLVSKYKSASNKKIIIIELPFLLQKEIGNNLICYLDAPVKTPLYAKRADDDDLSWQKVIDLEPSNSIGRLIECNLNEYAQENILDNSSKFIIGGINLSYIENGTWHIAKIGEEFLRFNEIEQISFDKYSISKCSRGEFGTNSNMFNHEVGERFLLLTSGYNMIPISEQLINTPLNFRMIHQSSDVDDKSNENLNCEMIYKDQKNAIRFDYEIEDKIAIKIKIDPSRYSIDTWLFSDSTLKNRYKITFVNYGISQEFITEDLYYEINISSIELSLYHEINIIRIT